MKVSTSCFNKVLALHFSTCLVFVQQSVPGVGVVLVIEWALNGVHSTFYRHSVPSPWGLREGSQRDCWLRTPPPSLHSCPVTGLGEKRGVSGQNQSKVSHPGLCRGNFCLPDMSQGSQPAAPLPFHPHQKHKQTVWSSPLHGFPCSEGAG